MSNYTITPKEKEYLRELAKEQFELSQLPQMKKLADDWVKHNDLKGDRPLVTFEMWTVEDAGFLSVPKCEGEYAKNIEKTILNNMANYKMVGDDRVVPDFYACYYRSSLLAFDLPVKRERTRGIGFHIEQQIKNLTTDFGLIKPSTMTYDKEGSIEWMNFVNEQIGDILPVRMSMGSFYVCLTNDIVHRMGMEDMFCAMMDTPDEFKYMMNLLSDDYITHLKEKEKRGMLCLNNSRHSIAQGTYGFTNDLPKAGFDPNNIRTTDCWGFMDSQETVGVDPDMFCEFFFPYYKKVADIFGLLSYGCCEPVSNFWEKSISKMPNLRKVSISAWCNEEYMGEKLRGSNIIYHRKPSPNFIGVSKKFDEQGFRKHIQKTLKAAKGCELEFSFRDVYNIEGDLNKPRRAVEVVREEIENNW